MRKVFSLLLALMIVCSLAVPAFASGGSVNLRSNKITITPAANHWTSTDLFGNFKGVMPGDSLTEKVTINNWALQYDYVTVYMEARRHEDEDDFQAADPQYGKDLDAMHDFLSQLEMTVTANGKEIYSDSPDQEDGLSTPKKLGTIKRGKSVTLKVTLDVPIELDNTYADRVGEVDWVFYFEGHNYDNSSPKTGDYVIMAAIALLIVSGAALLILFFIKRRKNRK